MSDTFSQTTTKLSPEPQHPACELCRFWDSSEQLDRALPDTTGLCRRLPPKLNKITGRAMWPFSEEGDWCGSYDIDPSKDKSPLPF